jgi:hypothetical protein
MPISSGREESMITPSLLKMRTRAMFSWRATSWMMLRTYSGSFFIIAKRVLRTTTSESWFTCSAAASSSSRRWWLTTSTANSSSVVVRVTARYRPTLNLSVLATIGRAALADRPPRNSLK